MAFPDDLLRLSELVADVITGAWLRTSDTGNRVEVNEAFGRGEVTFYGNDQEAPATIAATVFDDHLTLQIEGAQPDDAGGIPPTITLTSPNATDPTSEVNITAGEISFGARDARLKFGEFIASAGDESYTADAAGDIYIPHHMGGGGAAPPPVLLNLWLTSSASGRMFTLVGYDNTHLQVRVRSQAGGALAAAGSAVTLFWGAFFQ